MKPTEAEVITQGTPVSRHSVTSVQEVNHQQHQGIMMEKVLQVYTIETEQDLKARIEMLEKKKTSIKQHIKGLRDDLVKKSLVLARADSVQDKSIHKVAQALKEFGMSVSVPGLLKVQAVLSNMRCGSDLPEWVRGDYIHYSLVSEAELTDNDGDLHNIEAPRKCKQSPDVRRLVTAMRPALRELDQTQAALEQAETELETLPDKSKTLQAQILRDQIQADKVCGQEMTKLLDKACSGGLMRLR